MAWTTDSTPTGATLSVNGNTIDIEVGEDFRETVVSAARDAGFSKFDVYLNGELLDTSDAPEAVSSGDKIEIRRYEVAG